MNDGYMLRMSDASIQSHNLYINKYCSQNGAIYKRLKYGFGPCKYVWFQKQNILQGLFPKTKYFTGTFFYKMGSVIMCHVCKTSQKWGQGLFSKTIFCRDQKLQKKITGTKTKTRHICRDQNHILAFMRIKFANYQVNNPIRTNTIE
jgi:hypothetical protein